MAIYKFKFVLNEFDVILSFMKMLKFRIFNILILPEFFQLNAWLYLHPKLLQCIVQAFAKKLFPAIVSFIKFLQSQYFMGILF